MSAQRLKEPIESGEQSHRYNNSVVDSEDRRNTISLQRSINYGFGTQQTLDFSIQR